MNKVTKKELQEMDEFEYADYLEELIFDNMTESEFLTYLIWLMSTDDKINYFEEVLEDNGIKITEEGGDE